MTNPRWRAWSEGRALLLPLLVVGAVSLWFLPILALAAFAFAGVIVFAFRDPERAVTPRADVALSPCDGRVIAIRQVFDEHWQTDLTEIAVFLALSDVHVQRSPLAGVIEAQQRRAGGYRPAMTEAATHGNNQFSTYLRTDAGPCAVTQISGLVARRIVTWVGPGDRLAQGQRLGMIKFGSQVTLRLPLDVAVLVNVGDHVVGGITPVARLHGTRSAR